MYTFCKSLCVINEGSPYGLHGDPIYILYLYDHMWLVGNDSTITNLRQSLLCQSLLCRITGSDNYCATALMNPLLMMLTIQHKLCCPIKFKTLSNKDLKKPWIIREIISNIKKIQHYFALYCQNKIPKDFYTHFQNFVTRQIRRSKNVIMNIN